MTGRRRSGGFLIGLSIAAGLLIAGLASLGVWQVSRLAWKRDLIARVEARVHASPAPAPRIASEADGYRRIRVKGRFLHNRTVLVQASTVRGPGYWVMTPLATDQGFILLVNRGFVPPEARAAYARPEGEVRVTGFLRLTEPGGGFLRANDPEAGRWYSRDVAAILAAKAVRPPVTNYFMDAEAAPSGPSLPVGGLTVISFPNNHFGYAITWFALAVMVAGAYIIVMRHEWNERRK